MDDKPRQLDKEQVICLQDLAALVTTEVALLSTAEARQELEQEVRESKRLAQQMRETERQEGRAEWERLFNLSADMMCIAGTDGYFKRLNQPFSKTLGYSEAELKAKPLIEFVHPDDVTATLTQIEKLAIGLPTLHFVNRYRCKDGMYKWLDWTTTPNGDTLYAVARDVTERKQLEKTLHQAVTKNLQLAQAVESTAEEEASGDATTLISSRTPYCCRSNSDDR
jgi:PAS domain S-box-containing protein